MREKKIIILFIIILILLLILLVSRPNINLSGNAVIDPPSEIGVYFCPRDMCKEAMLSEIEKAREIKCAFYELNLPEVIAALKKKDAEVVIEDSTYEADSGFYSGYSKALMHNKFCILDKETVITGSMNPTINDNYLNNNNLVILKSRSLSENYLDEFHELKEGSYGKGSKTSRQEIYLGETKIENYFCPEDNCKLHVINALKAANRSIYFMVFSFTDEDIGNLLWNKNHLGLDVKGIFDASQISSYSRYEDLSGFSIIDKNRYKLHHKVFIIDKETVITGSFNPSSNANNYNDENIIIIHDKEAAEKYFREFERLFYYDAKIPDIASGLIFTKILYDAEGSDAGKEFIELKNTAGTSIILDYYSVSDGKANSRLSGILSPGDKIRVTPKFSLRNTNASLYLYHGMEISDFVAWDGPWAIKTGKKEILARINLSIDESAWKIDKI